MDLYPTTVSQKDLSEGVLWLCFYKETERGDVEVCGTEKRAERLVIKEMGSCMAPSATQRAASARSRCRRQSNNDEDANRVSYHSASGSTRLVPLAGCSNGWMAESWAAWDFFGRGLGYGSLSSFVMEVGKTRKDQDVSNAGQLPFSSPKPEWSKWQVE